MLRPTQISFTPDLGGFTPHGRHAAMAPRCAVPSVPWDAASTPCLRDAQSAVDTGRGAGNYIYIYIYTYAYIHCCQSSIHMFIPFSFRLPGQLAKFRVCTCNAAQSGWDVAGSLRAMKTSVAAWGLFGVAAIWEFHRSRWGHQGHLGEDT